MPEVTNSSFTSKDGINHKQLTLYTNLETLVVREDDDLALAGEKVFEFLQQQSPEDRVAIMQSLLETFVFGKGNANA